MQERAKREGRIPRGSNRRGRLPEIERFGPYRWVPIRSVEPPHRVRYPHYWLRLFQSFRRRGWHGRPLLVECVKGRGPGIRYVSWTGSHRLAAAFAAGIEEVPVVTIRGKLWDEVHGPAETVRLSETYDDEQRLAMLLVTKDKRAIRLMEREVPKPKARRRRKARRGEENPQELPWTSLGAHLEARVIEEIEPSGTFEVVEVRHKASGEIRGFGREVLEKLLELMTKRDGSRAA